jgi:proliferating cell nuclear antigen
MIGNTTSESDDAPRTDTTTIDVDPEPESNGEPATDSTTPDSETPESPPDEPDPDDPSSDDTPPETNPDAATETPPAFSATLTGEVLTTLLEIPTALIDEARLHADADGLTIASPDPANVAMAHIELTADGFTAYTATGGETGIDLEQASNMAGFYDNSTAITLTSDETGTLSYDGTDFSFTQGLITATSVPSLPELPELDDTTTCTVTTSFLEEAVTAGDMVADHLTLSGSDDAVTIAADGDTDHVAVTADGDDLIAAPGQTFEVLLSMDYMREIVRGLTGDTVTLEAGTGLPVIFEGDFADGAGRYEFILAPRLDDD